MFKGCVFLYLMSIVRRISTTFNLTREYSNSSKIMCLTFVPYKQMFQLEWTVTFITFKISYCFNNLYLGLSLPLYPYTPVIYHIWKINWIRVTKDSWTINEIQNKNKDKLKTNNIFQYLLFHNCNILWILLGW